MGRKGLFSAAIAAVCLLVVCGVSTVSAQVSRSGGEFPVISASGWGTLWGDVAYDPTNSVYLAVGGRGYGLLRGAFVTPSGEVGPSFAIATDGSYQDNLRVAYGGGSFLVTWTCAPGASASVCGRVLSYGSGGTALFNTEQIVISNTQPKTSLPVSVRYSTVSDVFLVAFTAADYYVKGRLVTRTGGVGSEFNIAGSTGEWDEYVNVGYSPLVDEFLVTFRSWVDTYGQMIARRVKATGEVVNQRYVFDGPSSVLYGPSSPEWDPSSSSWFIAFWKADGGSIPTVFGRWMDQYGTVGTRRTLAVGAGSYDSTSMARNASDGGFLAVFGDPYDSDLHGVHVLPDGTPETVFQVAPSAASGSWDPRVAASTATSDWLVTIVLNMRDLDGQFVHAEGGTPGITFNKQAPANHVTGLTETVDLSWSAVDNATYDYCVQTTTGPCSAGWQSAGTGTSAQVSGLTTGTTYYWQARATVGNSTAVADYGGWWSFTVGTPNLNALKQSPSNGASGVSSSPTLSWSGTPGASYQVCISVTKGSCSGWASTGTTASFWQRSSLPNGTYYWQVRATLNSITVDADNGAWWSFAIGPAAPTFSKQSPTNGATGVAASVTVSWTSAGNAGYMLCVQTTNPGSCTGSWQPVGGGLSYPISGLTQGITYYWQVQAQVGGNVLYADSNTWYSFTAGTPSGSVSKQSPSNGATGISTSPTLSWSSIANATYAVCVQTSNTGSCTTSWQSVGGTSTALSGLSASTTYYWQVRSTVNGVTTDADGGAWWSFTVASQSATFRKSAPASGTSGLGSSLTLTWTSAGNVGYWYCLTRSGASCDTGWQPVGGVLSRPLDGLAAGTYYWHVKAQLATGAWTESDDGTWSSFTVGSVGTVAKQSPANGATGVSSTPTLTWSSLSGATYSVCVSSSNGNCSGWISTGSTTSFTQSSLPTGTYYWQVRATVGNTTVDADGGAWWSFTVASQPATFTKSAPADGASGFGGSLTLTWTSAGNVGYWYCLTRSGAACDTGWQPVGGGLSRPLEGLAAGTYYWHVKAQLPTGAWTESDNGRWSSFTVGNIGTVAKQSPANGATGVSSTPTLTWSSLAGATYSVCVSTSNGNCSGWTSAGSSTSFVQSSLPTGTYYWQVRATVGSTTVDANGGAWWSFTVASQPATFTKTAPASGAGGFGSSLTLTWTSAGNVGYWYCLTRSGAACDTGWQPVGGGLSRPLEGLATGTYYWHVKAQLPTGAWTESDNGTWSSFTVGSGAASAAKQSPVNGAAGLSSPVTLSWSTVAGATYSVCISTANGSCSGGWASTGSTPSFTQNDLPPGLYYWQVRTTVNDTTTDANGGTWWSFTVGGAQALFTKQSPANGASGLSSALTLTWTSAGNSGYWVCLTRTGASCDSGWQPVGGMLLRPLTDLSSGTYYWQVKAQLATGAWAEADSGNWATFTVK